MPPDILPRQLLFFLLWLEFFWVLREGLAFAQIDNEVLAKSTVRLGTVDQKLVDAWRYQGCINEDCTVLVGLVLIFQLH